MSAVWALFAVVFLALYTANLAGGRTPPLLILNWLMRKCPRIGDSSLSLKSVHFSNTKKSAPLKKNKLEASRISLKVDAARDRTFKVAAGVKLSAEVFLTSDAFFSVHDSAEGILRLLGPRRHSGKKTKVHSRGKPPPAEKR